MKWWKRTGRNAPLGIVTLYLLLGALWTLYSNHLAARLVKEAEALSRLQTVGEWLYIVVTAGLLYALIRLALDRIRRSEAALQNSESRYRQLVEQNKEAMTLINTEGEVIFMNSACQAIFGYEAREFIADPRLADRILHPDYREQFAAFWQEYEGKGAFPERTMECAWIRKDGRVVYTENLVTNLVDAEGEVVGFQTVARDITRRKQAEKDAKHEARNIAVIGEMAIKLAAAPPHADIFQLITEELRAVTGAYASGLSVYDPETRELVTQHVSVNRPALRTIHRLLGGHLIGMRMPVSPQLQRRMLDEVVATAADLSEATFDVVPKRVARVIQKTLALGDFVGIALKYGEELVGSAVAAMPRGQAPPSRDMLETLAHVAAVSLRRRQAEEQLRFQSQLLDSVRESVVATDLEGRVTYWSRGAEALYGYAADEVMGKPVTFIVDPGEEEEEKRRMAQVTQRGYWSGQYVQRRKDGTSFWADTFISLVHDDKGRPTGLIGIDRDVTEQRRAEAALREEKAFTEDALNALSDLFFVVSPEGRFLRWNRALNQATGYSDEEIEKRRPRDLVTERSLPRLREAFASALNGERIAVEISLLTKRGNEVPYEIAAVLLKTAEGDPLGVCGIGRNVTARKRLLEEVRHRNRMLAALNAIVGAMGQSLELESVLEAVLQEMLEILPLEGGMVFLYDVSSSTPAALLLRRAVASEHSNLAANLSDFEGLSRRVMELNQPLIVRDSTPDLREMSLPDGTKGFYAAAPIRSKKKSLGAIAVIGQGPDGFHSDNLGLLAHVGNQIGIAYENIRLFDEVRAGREQLRRLARRLVVTQEEERRRLSRELHDEAGQALTALEDQPGADGRGPTSGRRVGPPETGPGS